MCIHNEKFDKIVKYCLVPISLFFNLQSFLFLKQISETEVAFLDKQDVGPQI